MSVVDSGITNPNINSEFNWQMTLGNDENFSKAFYGSFKDFRLWKSVRSDGELHTNRFVQANPADENLQVNFRFMDGNTWVINQAGSDLNSFATTNQMKLIKSDDKNVICSGDTFFNPKNQECTRYPFNSDVKIISTPIVQDDDTYEMQF